VDDVVVSTEEIEEVEEDLRREGEVNEKEWLL
jgi:hypothetical protein